MAGEKKFGTSMFGFKKSDVNAYIERIIREFDQRLKEKDEEISSLKLESRELKRKYDQVIESAEQIIKDKERIAGALIQAQEKAENIITEAQSKAVVEKNRLDEMLESEKEKIIDVKRELNTIRTQVTDILSKYDSQIDSIVDQIQKKEQEYYQPDENTYE